MFCARFFAPRYFAPWFFMTGRGNIWAAAQALVSPWITPAPEGAAGWLDVPAIAGTWAKKSKPWRA